MFDDPSHELINENNPFVDHFDTINLHYTKKTKASDGRLCRQRFTDTKTRIKNKKRRKNKRQ